MGKGIRMKSVKLETSLNVYDENDIVVKTVKANVVDIRFGTIRKLVKLLGVEEVEDTNELMTMVFQAWEEVTKLLSKAFPEMEEEDWEYVKVSELLRTIITIFKGSANYMLGAVGESEKNSETE